MLHYIAVLLFGALLTFSYAPFSLWFLTPILLTGLFYRLLLSKSGFKTGFAFGLGWFGAGISWVHVSIADFGGLPLVGSVGLMILLCSFLALYPGLFCFVLKRYCQPRFWPLLAPFIWFLCEFVRSWLFTGFPWLSIGYSQLSGPLSGWMPVLGETGVSVLLIAICSSIALSIKQKTVIPSVALTGVVLISGWALNAVEWVSAKTNSFSIAMVQGNIKQEMRWAPEEEVPTMTKYLKLTKEHWHNELIIWPEAAIPRLESTAESFLHDLDTQAANNDSSLITGIVNYNYDSRQAFNNLITLGKKSPSDTSGQYHYLHANRYDKHHLLPFGEFIPFESWLRELAPIFDLPMSSFTRGDYLQPNLIANGINLAPAICFEIAFPRQIAANLTPETDFIITVSNDAWFGRSHGPDQHLEIAQVRAKEFGLPVLRATNNGITAFIGYDGEVISRLPQFQAGVLSAEIASTSGSTPYRRWGDLPLWILSLIVLAWVWREAAKNKT
ncbi:apolipoprotein N-acyltransferase [Aliiglaciecola sp. 3_MG-2023]|uniref:apolipoprotein N-acyltransferase n=1 Tax=Aliiglaciecola sp. 3_MG-2023 TaxID=3062644 RepID=UPI0026E1C537|nr:apolipoprotein N-acyltransferase [Aliiglaciecola sp. 3_MG-2023]MDO6694415.1 apolipoprotein N-acyltransferase [Aliiglaciecola sp. 3_MG-2023]